MASLAAWYLAETLTNLVHWDVRGPSQPAPDRARNLALVSWLIEAAREAASTKNGAMAVGILGGVYASFLGAAGGWSRASRAASLRGGIVGLSVGPIVGASLPFVLFPLFYRARPEPSHSVLPLLIHTAIYTAICGVGGLAFGYGVARARGAARGLAAATMGALGGTMLFHLVHTYYFPLEWDFSPLPGTVQSRFLILLCAALCAAFCSAAVLSADGQEAPDGVPPKPGR